MMSKDKQYFKMDRPWRDLFIGSILGPQLSMLGVYEPKSVAEFGRIIEKMLIAESRDEKYKDNPDIYIADMSEKMQELWQTFIGHKLLKYLKEGRPRTTNNPRIITNLMNRQGHT